MRFHSIEEAFGSEWREENKTLDDKVCRAITDLAVTEDLERYKEIMDSLLLTAECLVEEGRISEQTYWNYCGVNRMVSESYEKLFGKGWKLGEWE